MRFDSKGTPTVGRNRRWLNDGVMIFQARDESRPGEVYNLVDQLGRLHAAGGVMYLAAGGGLWSDTGTRNMRSNFDYDNVEGRVWDIGHGGLVVDSPNYQSGTTIGLWKEKLYITGRGISDARATTRGFVTCFDLDKSIYASEYGTEADLPKGIKPFRCMLVNDLLLYSTHKYLVLQEYKAKTDKRIYGRVIAKAPTFEPDMVHMTNFVRVGWYTNPAEEPLAALNKEDIPIFATRFEDITELTDADPIVVTPTPTPTPTPEIPVDIPNDSRIVNAVDAEHKHLLQQNTPETCKEFYWRAARALHEHDSKWGMLSKSAGENGQEIPGAGRVSVDAITYKGTDQAVDIMKSAHDGPGTGGVSWSVSPKRESNLWVAPPPFDESEEPQEPEEPEEPSTPEEPPAGNDDPAVALVLAEIVALLSEIKDNQQKTLDAMAAQTNALNAAVTELKTLSQKGVLVRLR